MKIKYIYFNKIHGNVEVGLAPQDMVPEGAIVIPCDQIECEDDPTGVYQQAWYLDGDKVKVDIDKAKAIKLRQIKETREEHLDQFDRLQARHIGSGNTAKVKQIETIKQSLRDMPETIDWDAIKTVDDLRQIAPPILGYD